MTIELQKFYYAFSHIGLPQIYFNDGAQLHKKLFGNSSNKEINRLWKTLADEFNLKVSEELSCEDFPINDEYDLLIITMPKPTDVTEVYYIGLVFSVEQKFFTKTVTPYKYFTLELGEPKQSGTCLFCEWETSSKHNNYGDLIDSSIRTFWGAIRSIIKTEKISKKYLPNSPIKNQNEGNGELNKLIENLDKEEQEFRPILSKWSEQIPNELYNQAFDFFDLFYKRCTALCWALKTYANNSEEMLKKYQKAVNESVYSMAGKSLIIGVDFGFKGLCNSDVIKSVEEIPESAARYLRIIGEPATMTYFFLNEEVLKIRANSQKPEKYNFQEIVNSQILCFKFGVNYGEELRKEHTKDNVTPDNLNEPQSNEVYKDLLDVAFSDPNPEVRRQAQIGIQELFPGGPQAFENLLFKMIEGLRDPNIRALSLITISGYGELALPYLKPYLKDPDPEMRKCILQIVIEIEKNIPS